MTKSVDFDALLFHSHNLTVSKGTCDRFSIIAAVPKGRCAGTTMIPDVVPAHVPFDTAAIIENLTSITFTFQMFRCYFINFIIQITPNYTHIRYFTYL